MSHKTTPRVESLDHYAKGAVSVMHNAWDEDLSILERVIGLSEETGEVSAVIKKALMRDGWGGFELTAEDIDKLCDELGDVLFYVAIIADLIDVPLSYIASWNLQKLRGRNDD